MTKNISLRDAESRRLSAPLNWTYGQGNFFFAFAVQLLPMINSIDENFYP